MAKRKIPLVTDEVYHLCTKSIAGFKILRDKSEFERMRDVFEYYKIDNPDKKYSIFSAAGGKNLYLKHYVDVHEHIVEVIAYCLMPTHIHLLAKQIKDNGISQYMGNILNSYSRFFNENTRRKGPLWQSRFQNVHIKTDEQLLHVTRYIHLNPVTAGIIPKPELWEFSSYREYLGESKAEQNVCAFSSLLDIEPAQYKKFVNSQIVYQKELAYMKKFFLE